MPGFIAAQLVGAADHETTMAIFRRVRDEIEEWLRGFIAGSSDYPAITQDGA